jgi:hypothetical protein
MVLLSLGAVYYIALGIMPSITYRLPIMELAGWLGANQTTASYAYLVGTHTIGVFLAALPIAIAFALLMSGHSIWLSLVVSLPPILDLVFGFWMFTGIDYVADQSLKLIVFYLTDALKIALTVPFLAWLISKYAPERRRTASA